MSMAHRGLNIQQILQRRCKNWVLLPSACCLLLMNTQNLDHFILHCPICSYQYFCVGCLYKRVDRWLFEKSSAWNMPERASVQWNCAVGVLLQHIWFERNQRTFDDKSSSFGFFWRNEKLPASCGVIVLGNYFVMTTFLLCLSTRRCFSSLLWEGGSHWSGPISCIFHLFSLINFVSY